ncbi:antitoxin [bacterium]|jgi:hypothetical protein|nr:antitoxin [Acidimicrobiaceae bacterium]MCH9805583.1 antitoxin [bacterium]MDB2391516.1 antitoxin [Acidimicrobiaceae bacterium]MDB4109960.1 antitoxin [bacterium]
MGLLDKVKGMLSGNADKVKGGLEKAGDMVDEKTGGKFTDNIDMAEEKIAEVLEVDGEAEAEA